MNINTTKEAVMLCRKANIALMMWGHAGVGKSSLVAQAAEANKLGCINMRLSQMEASDLRGLPDRVDGRTQYLPPADMPRGGLSWEEFIKKIEEAPDNMKQTVRVALTPLLNEGILFLDEINRAQDDVLQAAFELVLDKKIGTYVLPEGWSIVCAGNYNEGSYITNGFTDAAFLDRFCHIQVSTGEPTLNEWVGFMSDKYGEEASQVVSFVTQDLARLDGVKEGELGFSIQPSRRSWEMVAKVLQAGSEFSQEAQHGVIAGLVGLGLATSFMRYNCPVHPRDLIEKGVKANESKLNKLKRDQMVGLMWGLISYLKKNIDNEKESKVALDFAEWMAKSSKEHDLIAAFLRGLVDNQGGVVGKLKAAMITNPKAAALIKKAVRKNKQTTFLDRLTANKELHSIVSKLAWGKED